MELETALSTVFKVTKVTKERLKITKINNQGDEKRPEGPCELSAPFISGLSVTQQIQVKKQMSKHITHASRKLQAETGKMDYF